MGGGSSFVELSSEATASGVDVAGIKGLLDNFKKHALTSSAIASSIRSNTRGMNSFARKLRATAAKAKRKIAKLRHNAKDGAIKAKACAADLQRLKSRHKVMRERCTAGHIDFLKHSRSHAKEVSSLIFITRDKSEKAYGVHLRSRIHNISYDPFSRSSSFFCKGRGR